MGKKKVVGWKCNDFGTAPFFQPNYIACTYTKAYVPQTSVVLDKDSGDVKIWSPKSCEVKKDGYVVCKIMDVEG